MHGTACCPRCCRPTSLREFTVSGCLLCWVAIVKSAQRIVAAPVRGCSLLNSFVAAAQSNAAVCCCWLLLGRYVNSGACWPGIRALPASASLQALSQQFNCFSAAPQIQADLGFGHEHVIKAYEAVLTPTHLCLGGCTRWRGWLNAACLQTNVPPVAHFTLLQLSTQCCCDVSCSRSHCCF